MPRPPRQLPRYVKPIRRGARLYLYFRHGRTYLRLPDDPESAEFHAAYAAAKAGIEHPGRAQRCPDGSIAAMIRDYKAAPEFLKLAPKTRRDYARALDHLGLAVGPFPASAIRRADVIKLRNKISGRGTRSADLWVAVVSRCFTIGMDLGYVETNPAATIGRINEAEEFQPWPREARALFEASSPPAHLMTAYMIALWTAQGLGDTLRLARPAFDGTGFTVRRAKTEARGYIPAAAPLKAYLATLPRDGVLFVTRPDGRRLTERGFSEEFRAWLDGLGLDALQFHGLRKTTASALADAGASAHEIAAITLHQTMAMVEHYTKGADQRRLATAAIRKLDKAERTKNKP